MTEAMHEAELRGPPAEALRGLRPAPPRELPWEEREHEAWEPDDGDGRTLTDELGEK